MDCPQCKTGYPLEPRQLESGLFAAGCNGCGGALLSLINYRFWAETHETESSMQKVSVEVEDNTSARICPKCSRLMTKFHIALDTANKIDLCVHCDETWLDKGEWRLLKQLDLHNKLPSIFTEAWQRNIRHQKQADSERVYFENILGTETFEKVNGFRQWLDNEAEKETILHYLSLNGASEE